MSPLGLEIGAESLHLGFPVRPSVSVVVSFFLDGGANLQRRLAVTGAPLLVKLANDSRRQSRLDDHVGVRLFGLEQSKGTRVLFAVNVGLHRGHGPPGLRSTWTLARSDRGRAVRVHLGNGEAVDPVNADAWMEHLAFEPADTRDAHAETPRDLGAGQVVVAAIYESGGRGVVLHRRSPHGHQKRQTPSVKRPEGIARRFGR
jgi:hypothetical protein